MAKKEKKIKGKTATGNNFILSVISGLICGISVTVILSMILSAISLKIKNPINFAEILSIICVSLGAVSCSITASYTNKNKPILSSLTSLIILSSICVISTLNYDNKDIINIIFFPLMILFFGIISALIINGNHKKKKIKKYLK